MQSKTMIQMTVAAAAPMFHLQHADCEVIARDCGEWCDIRVVG